MGLIKNIDDTMSNLSKTKFIFTILALNFVISTMFNFIINLYEKYMGTMGSPDYSDLKTLFISAIIIAPLVETLVFQKGIINLFSLSEKIKSKKLILIIISAIFFGLVHGVYSVLYIIRAFMAGILLAYSFILYEDKENSGFWVTAIIHSLMNLVSIIVYYIELVILVQ